MITLAPLPSLANLSVEDLSLLDQNGTFHELYYYSDKTAIVLVSQGNGCPIIRQSLPYLEQLKTQYEPVGVQFFMINANRHDDRDSIRQEADQFHITIPILEDPSQVITRALGITRTAEVIVIDPSDWTVIYHGPIHDQLNYEGKKTEITHHYLKDVLQALIDHQPIPAIIAKPKGCLIHFSSEEYTYAKDVAPILMQKCAICHTKGGAAPWSMDSYAKIVGWGPMIREVIRTQRMPPWQADPHYGKFVKDLSLTPEEVSALVRWVEQGFVMGGKKDPLVDLSVNKPSTGWSLGQPDMVISLKEEQTIPADAVDLYRYIEGETEIKEDIWVRALEIRPTNPRVLHHCNIVVEKPSEAMTGDAPAQSYERSGLMMDEGQMIAGFSPGMGPMIYPSDTGVFIPKGSKIIFRLHYVTTGKEETDRTTLGLYLSEKPPAKILSVKTITYRDIKIPPGEKDYRVKGERTFKKPVVITALQPHMHYRGRSMRFIFEYPNGTSEVALSVPNYKFSWQRYYVLEHPKRLPAGTKIIAEGSYDNSKENPNNPNASEQVNYGPGSNQEMFTGIVFYIEDD